MQILIRCVAEGDGEDVSAELFDWLVDDADARRHAAPRLLDEEPGPGKLGAVAIIQLTLSGAFSATSLGVVIAQWREQRRAAAAAHITVTVEKDGKQFTVTGLDAAEIQRKVDELDAA
ncbi:hypothetical protein [Streptomyces sp. NPDC059651]|uniref:effector-associated constant component EACC1 n=1 Tax=unclassified Streptomyces TaxID=2593676 RepID=UPI000A7F2799